MDPPVLSIVVKAGADPDYVKRRAIALAPGSIVQTVSADAASNGFLVEMIAAQTLRAKGTPSQLAKRPEVDLLLRLAGTTQISRAIEQIGARKGRPFLLVIAGPSRRIANLGAEALGGSELGRRKLSPGELDRVEKAALLNTQKS